LDLHRKEIDLHVGREAGLSNQPDAILDLSEERRGAEASFVWLCDEVEAWKRRFDLDGAALSVRDFREARAESERKSLQERVTWLRSHLAAPGKLLALRHGLGMLEAACGHLSAAQKIFQEVATQIGAPGALAQVQHNAYLVALERDDWAAALAALNQAAALDPEQFAPFPVDQYESVRILGAGGFAVVFLCRDRRTGLPVVIKAIQTIGENRDWPDWFHEVGVLKELDHTSIIRLLDHGHANEAAKARPYLVMEYFDSLSLADYVIRYGPLSQENVLAVARPVADALRAAHAHGIWHRDVKPGNVLIRCDGSGWQVKLIDFGVAMRERAPDTLGPFGTVDYAAPEQMGQLPGVGSGPYTDVYGFARTCCYALFGTPHLSAEALERLPTSLSRLLTQCLMEEPQDRPPDLDAVLAQLPNLKEMVEYEAPTQPTAPIAPQDHKAKPSQTGEPGRLFAEHAVIQFPGQPDSGTPDVGPVLTKTALIGEEAPRPLIKENPEVA
jgi:serine/threonine protein kinase